MDIRKMFMKMGGEKSKKDSPKKEAPKAKETRASASPSKSKVEMTMSTPSPAKRQRETPETKVSSKYFSGEGEKGKKGKQETSPSKKAKAVEVVDLDSDEAERPPKGRKVEKKAVKVEKKVVDLDSDSPDEKPKQDMKPVKAETKPAAAEKSPEKKSRVLPNWMGGPSIKTPEKDAAKGKKRKEEDEDDDFQESGSKKSKSTPKSDVKSAVGSAGKAENKPDDKKDEAPKKKWNPYNQERKDIPNKHLKDQKIEDNKGADNCLEKMTFVITGVLDSMEREEATELIKSYGGKVTGSVSGKTAYLIAGEEPGESKIKKAQSLKTKVIDEDGLLALIKASAKGSGGASAASSSASKNADTQQKTQKGDTSKATAAASPAKPVASVSKQPSAVAAGKQPASTSTKKQSDSDVPSLWVDKYKPMKRDQLMGNGDKVKILQSWLREWTQGSDKKAALVTGPPGIGKSTTARLIIQECGYDMVEMNASDVRSKNSLQEHVESLTTNQSLAGFFKQKPDSKPVLRKTCLVMDEVDGMSGGDRGGIQELIQLIKHTRVPIICIANDYYDRKISSLKSHCNDIKFGRPNKNVVTKRLEQIAKEEGLNVPNTNVLEKILEASNNDIRHCINMLQTWKMRTNTLAYSDVAKEIERGGKETATMQSSVFDVVNEWFLDGSRHSNARFGERLDMFFFDSDLVPLLVQENYLKVKTTLTKEESQKPDLSVMERMAEAADAISYSDVINNDIRRNQHWGLLPFYGTMSTVRAGYHCRGQPPTFFAKEPWMKQAFTKALGFMSTMNKRVRLTSDIERCMKMKAGSSRAEVACDYVPLLRQRICAPLTEKGAEGIDEVIEFMEEYFLTKEELDSIVGDLRIPDERAAPDLFGKIETQVKSGLTRRYNKESHKIAFVKTKGTDSMTTKGARRNIGRSGDVEKEEDDGPDEDEDEEGEDGDAAKNKAAGGTKGSSSKKEASGKGSSKGSAKASSSRGGKAPQSKKKK